MRLRAYVASPATNGHSTNCVYARRLPGERIRDFFPGMSGDSHVDRRGGVWRTLASQGFSAVLKRAEVEGTPSLIERVDEFPIAISKQRLGGFAPTKMSTSQVLGGTSAYAVARR